MFKARLGYTATLLLKPKKKQEKQFVIRKRAVLGLEWGKRWVSLPDRSQTEHRHRRDT